MKFPDSNKRALVAFIAVVAFMYSVFLLSSFFQVADSDGMCMVDEECPHESLLNQLIFAFPLAISIAIVVGALTYYLMSGRVETKQKSLIRNTELLLRFLNQDEKKVVNALIESRGKVLQAEITRLPGMGKVRSHRVVRKLLDRGVIEKDTLGKTNIIRFPKEIKEGLQL
jgi:uncharacterized membrane protein